MMFAVLLFPAFVSAQQTINYTNGQVDPTDYDTTAPHDPTTLSILSGMATQSGILSGTGSVFKTGSGTIILSSANTYIGGTTITAGTLQLSGAATLGGTTGALTVNAGGTLDLNDTEQDVGHLTGTGGTISNNGSSAATLRIGNGNGSGGNFLGMITDGSGTVALTKTGAGTVTLAGVNSYTGASTINAGTLKLDFSAQSVGTNNLISGSSALVLGGGTLNVKGKSTGTNSQTFASTTIHRGHSAVIADSNGNSGTNVNLAAITRDVGGTVDFTLPANGNITTSTSAANGILGGWATVGGTDWATVSGGNIGVATYTNNTWSSGNNTNVTASALIGSGSTTNSLRFATAGAQTLTLSGINTLQSGGILVTSGVGANDTTITGGKLRGAAGTDLVVINNNPSNRLRIDSTIVDNSSATGLTKSGAGTLVLTGANTYTGDTNINAGTLILQNGGSISNSTGLGEFNVGGLGPGTLVINGGTISGMMASNLGREASSVGNATVTSGTWSTGLLQVGAHGTGSLLINGGSVTTSQPAGLGTFATGNGSLTVTSGSFATTWSFLVGASGTGSLSLQGGSITTGGASVAYSAGSTGSATVTGGTWDSGESFEVGNSGNGSVVMQGGTITASIQGFIGRSSGGNGMVTVEDGTFDMGNNLFVGTSGTGSLTVSGGIATAGNLVLGYNGSGTGSLTVQDGSATGNLYVGYSGEGNLVIDGGTVSSGLDYIGFNSTGMGAATVTSGTWTSANGISVGFRGTGALLVNGGAVSTSGYISLGGSSGSTGSGTVSSGSLQADSLSVGSQGTGNLNVTGGTVSTATTTLASDTAAVGTITVTGGTWTNSGDLNIGLFGAGHLVVDGGTVNSDHASLGATEYGGSGTATVSSGTWAVTNALLVGDLGEGSLTVNGGSVSASTLTVAANSVSGSNRSTGSMTMTDGSLAVSGLLSIGGDGDGSLLLSGGSVTSGSGFIGGQIVDPITNVRGSGTATINDGSWAMTGSLTVGGSGTGDLTLNGGEISSGTGAVGGQVSGTVTVNGGIWSSAGELRLGFLGSGILNLNGTAPDRGVVAVATLRSGTFGMGFPLPGGTGTVNFNGGILRALADGSDFVDGFPSGRLVLNSGGGFVDSNGFDIGIKSPLSGTGALTKLGDGTLTLSAVNTYTGGTTVSAGTLLLSGSGTLGSTSGALTVNTGGTLDLNNHSLGVGNLTGTGGTITTSTGGTVTLTIGNGGDFQGAITNGSGTVALTKTGTGTLTLSGTNTYSGATTINAGKLVVNGSALNSTFTINAGGSLGGSGNIGALSIANASTISPGNSPGILSVDGAVEMGGGANFIFEINSVTGTAGGSTGWDLLSATGDITFVDADITPITLFLTSLTPGNVAGMVSNFNSGSDYSFTFATGSSGIPDFSSSYFDIHVDNFANSFTGDWSIVQSGNSLNLVYTAVPEPSTFLLFAGSAFLVAVRRRS